MIDTFNRVRIRFCITGWELALPLFVNWGGAGWLDGQESDKIITVTFFVLTVELWILAGE